MQVGKEIGISAATNYLSMVGSVVGGASTEIVKGFAGELIKTGVTAAVTVASTSATTLISSGGDWKEVKASFNSFSDWSGVISSAAGSLVTASLGAANLTDGNNIALFGGTFDVNSVGKFNGLVGGLTSSAITYGFTGEATFNVLNLADFGTGVNCGLFEMTVGKNGLSSRIGTGGTDISFGTLRSATEGFKEANKIVSWKYGDEEKRSTLNSINMLGWTDNDSNRSLSKNIWNGKLKVVYGDTGSDYGNYKRDDTKITLSRDLLGGGKEASAKLATVMAHEGTHYYGNKIEGVAHSVGAETYAQINKMFALEADSSFSNSMIEGIINPKNWIENSGDIDHWAFASDDNGVLGWKWDEDFDFNTPAGKISAENMKAMIETQKQLENIDFVKSLGLTTSSVNSAKEKYFKSATPSEQSNALSYMQRAFYESGNPDGYFDFMRRTEGFADASIAGKYLTADVKGVKDGNLSQQGIEQLNKALYSAQESGLLVKNAYGTIDTTGLVEVNGCFVPVQLGPGQAVHDISTLSGLRMLYSEKQNKFQDNIPHTGIDIRGVWDSNVVSGSDSSNFNLKYDDVFGLRGINTYTDQDHTDYLSHLETEPTIKAFFSNFGKEGVSIDSKGNLTGIKKGTVLGNVGNTGSKSNGDHLDWIVSQKKKNISPLTSSIFGKYLANATRTYEATILTGLPLNYDMKSEDAYNRVKSYYNWAYTNNCDLNYAQKLLNSYTTKYADEIWERNLKNGVPGYISKQKVEPSSKMWEVIK